MMNRFKIIILALGIFGILSFANGIHTNGLTTQPDNKEINWMSFNQAVELNKQHPKKIFIDMYTNWCGWCKHMDATTYKDPAIISYINKYYYAVRLDAETGDTFHFQGHVFFNSNPHQRGYVNDLAYTLVDGKLAYPTTLYMDENFARLTYVQGFLESKDLSQVLHYFAENKYKTMSFDDFKKSISAADSAQ